MKRIVSLIVVTLLVLTSISCALAEEKETLYLAYCGCITGAAAEQGETQVNGMKLAISEANAAGDLPVNLDIIVLDDQANPQNAATCANNAASNNDVIAVIGHTNSSCTLAGAPIYEDAELPMIAVGSSSPKISDAGDYIFRVWNSDTYTATVQVETLLALGFTKIGCLYENNDYGLGAYNVTVERLAQEGLELLVSESYELGQTKDFTNVLTKMKQAGVEAIFCVTDETELPLICSQAHNMLDYWPTIASTGAYSTSVLEVGGEDVNGLWGTTLFDPDNMPEKVSAFMESYKAMFGEDVSSMTGVTAYIATNMVIDAIRQNGATRADIEAFLTGLTDYDTIVGPLSFDENGDTMIPLVRMRIENGAFVADYTIE